MPDSELLGSAYDLSSCGIGVQRALVEALIEEKELTDFLEGELFQGSKSNLLTHAIMFGESSLGEQYATFKDRHSEVSDKYHELERIALRSAIRGDFVDNGGEYSFPEFEELMGVLFQGNDLSEDQMNKLYGARNSIMEFGGALIQCALPEEDFDGFGDQRKAYLRRPELNQRYLHLHTEKLDLMIDIFSTDLEISGANKNSKPDGIEWAENWKRLFGEELPIASELISSAKETVLRAREYYNNAYVSKP